MLVTITTLALALASTVSGHAAMFSVSVNGKDLGDGQHKYIRTPANHNPVKDLKSPDLACNTNGGTPAPSFVKAAAGDKLAFRWFNHFDPSRPDMILDPSHLGAILTYIAPYTTGSGAGPIWSKLQHSGFEGGEWATIKMRAAGGDAEFTLPKRLAPGQYLIRQELLALHMADSRGDLEPDRGAETYPSCVQVEVTGSGDAVPDQDFDFNRGYKYDDPGWFFNIYIGKNAEYKPPGPKVWTP